MSRLRSQVPPLTTAFYINHLIALRVVFNELAWSEQLVELARLIRREDIPRAPQRLPRPLSTEQDQLLQKEFLRRNDLGGNVFLLIRHTGMRIGECADLSCDCLRSTGPNQWAVHVPLGKLRPSVWFLWIRLSVKSFNALHSFVPWIRYLRTESS
jgi:integrase